MVTGIIGRKVGMTQVFETDGTVVPATVIKAGPCVVVQAKAAQTDGYESVQLGLVDDTPAKVDSPTAGHFKKAGVPPTRVRREVKIVALTSGLYGRNSHADRNARTKGNSSIARTDLLKNGESDRSISVHIGRISARLKSEYCRIWRVWRARQGSNLRPPA